ncbi:type VI secretion system baseplate subunit TssK [Limnobaculum zhutongyuii]|uniref:Type VI secretion system baseplate subunit TssK n=1 Tax=Limnobaculum zhutongyuii TaxID=2498113 RepID=A0A411WLC6_9GAMM|nr:type VI secretion system baseplate subunit TssK [Limnobaculum zhutongyuii]QBH97039.1 type VI secretion system baseplate subunit TssK [Limnobaculum zhutongyuii]TQS87411.1 type VI secretion system baseplate subunit TssK [Limnobaculum zhutongyuii]
MANKNRVVWREGLSIAPQHLQQQQRHIDYLVHGRVDAAVNYSYGFSRLSIDHEMLKLGRVSITDAAGVMPDGTLFDIPFEDIPPQPIEIRDIPSTDSRDIYLALPIVSDAITEIHHDSDNLSEISRFKHHPHQIRDLHTQNGNYVQVSIARLAPRLIRGSDNLSAYTLLPLCRIKEVGADGMLTLDETFIPTISKVRVAQHLQTFLEEVANLVAERARQLSDKIGSPTQQGISGVAEFLMLQLLNSAKPTYRHLAHTQIVHPETLYLMLTKTCSELMTFTSESKTAQDFQLYNHDDLTRTFRDLILKTRLALSIVLTPRAVPIPLIDRSGVHTGVINDVELLRTANFVLAVKAQLPQDQLIRLFVQQTKISTPTKIEHLVRVQVPGIPLTPLSAAPPQLPFHAGYIYFQLDSQAAEWEEVIKSNSIAFHVAGNFPELDLQFWAVRSK